MNEPPQILPYFHPVGPDENLTASLHAPFCRPCEQMLTETVSYVRFLSLIMVYHGILWVSMTKYRKKVKKIFIDCIFL